jgi:hypothetical protein
MYFWTKVGAEMSVKYVLLTRLRLQRGGGTASAKPLLLSAAKVLMCLATAILQNKANFNPL